MNSQFKLSNHMFSKFGIELEYMIVDQQSLNIKSITDRVIYDICGEYLNEIEFTQTAWSNELALHQIEIKNTPPTQLDNLPKLFQQQINKINSRLEKFSAKLLPTGAHPWMNPKTEIKLWPHGAQIIYETYNRIFNCRGHGWTNLQSVHLNLPFNDDNEFAKLHTAIRLILPIIPALCASTPIIEGKFTNVMDNRLMFYAQNQAKIPSITGLIIPEVVLSEHEYKEKILTKIYKDIAPLDPQKILQHEWLNSRGAIARFERKAIEIRIIDSQETVFAEVALAYFIAAILKATVDEIWIDFKTQCTFYAKNLAKILFASAAHGMNARIEHSKYLSIFNYTKSNITTTKTLIAHIYEQLLVKNYLPNSQFNKIIEYILTKGTLAERIITALNNNYSLDNIKIIYDHIANCLAKGEIF